MYSKETNTFNLFFLFYLLYCFKSIVYSLTIDTEAVIYIKHFLNIAILLLCFISVCYASFKTKIFFAVTTLLCLLNIILYNNDSYYAFIVLIAICSLTIRIEWSTLIRSVCLIHLIALIITLPFLYFCDYFFLVDDRFGPRFTGGFDNPNTLGQYLIMLLSVITLWLNDKTKTRTVQFVYFIFIFTFINIILFETFSRTSLILACTMGILFIITRLTNFTYRSKKYFYPFVLLLIIIAFFQFYGIAKFGTNKYLAIANEVFTSRLWFGNILYKEVGFPDIWHGLNINDYLPLDFYFIRVVYSVGVLYFLALTMIFLISLRRCKMNIYMWVVLFIMLTDTLTETYFSIPFYSAVAFIIFNKTNFDCHRAK